MNKTIAIIAVMLTAVLFGISCGSAPNTNSAANQTTNTTVANTAKVAEVIEEEIPTSNYQTPTEAYKAAYKARKNQDVSTLKGLFSKDILEFFTEMAKAGGRSLDEELTELASKPQADSDEVRNEKIEGDMATLEYMDEKGKWRSMDLVKEDGGWKLTIAEAKPGEVEIGPKGKK